MLRDKQVRINTVTRSHFWFFSFYFAEFITYETAPFQHEMMAMTEDEDTKLHVVIAFRNSGKSTIFNESYALWSIFGRQQRKFILILGQTQTQAQQYLQNIKNKLEQSQLLKNDLGPFQEESGQWGASALVIPRFNAKIMIGSVEQSIRGLRYNQYRPDLIIVDDVEDLGSAKTKEGRDKVWNWLNGEVIPAGDRNTKMIVVGNLVHEDCSLRRFQQAIHSGNQRGIYAEYPIIGDEDKALWPGKYPTQTDIKDEEMKIGNKTSWAREFLLKIISEKDRAIHKEWLQFYDVLPSDKKYKYTGIGIDLAISLRDQADCTAMVPANVYGNRESLEIYILPQIVNRRITSLETLEEAKRLSDSLGERGRAKLYVEEVAYQKSLIEHLKRDGYPVKGVKVYGQDKLARLNAVSYLVQSGKVFFPIKGAERLIAQLVGFGIEKHDDLADAFSILLSEIIEDDRKIGPSVTSIERQDWWDNPPPAPSGPWVIRTNRPYHQ